MSDALALALDRFDVPPSSAGLADRIMAVATVPTQSSCAVPRRDRRGMWRRGRQVLLGTLAVGLLSAGAVASGMLGKVGIEVPVLTAMLAPKSKPVAKAVHVVPEAPPIRAVIEPSAAIVVDSTPAVLLPRPLLPGERLALREARRERRLAFAAEHPVAAAAIRQRVREQLQQRALARRQALMMPGIDPSIPGTGSLDPLDRGAPASWIVWLLAIVWTADSAAYLVGRTIGRRKLAPVLSPRKSLEGFVGGILVAGLVGALIAGPLFTLGNNESEFLLWGLVWGLIIATAAEAGDLLESLFKRVAGAESASNLIPGHGGVLDRIDSLLLAAPVTLIAALLLRG
jgi:uncharacterized membrane protein YeaQ/YmgE (transglycosylase-associated protein family)